LIGAIPLVAVPNVPEGGSELDRQKEESMVDDYEFTTDEIERAFDCGLRVEIC